MTAEERAGQIVALITGVPLCLDDGGPEAWLTRKVAEVVRAIRAEERERCARTAEALGDVYNLGNCIARDIRALT